MIVIDEKKKEKLLAFIDAHSAFIIAGHKEPDGDSITSSLAMLSLVKRLGKKGAAISEGPFRRPEVRKYEQLFEKTWSFPPEEGIPGVFIVDCSANDRLGDSIVPQLEGLPRFIIDHHKTSLCNDENCIILPEAPATAYLIQMVFELLNQEIDAEVAKMLFFGLATDTGFFRFVEAGHGDVFEAAGRLITKGASPRLTQSAMSGNKSFASRKLLGRLMDRAELHYDGRLAFTWETLEDTEMVGKGERDSDMLYQLLLGVSTIEVIVFVRQDTQTTCTAGLRSRDLIEVRGVASAFGGGGHRNASGLSTEGTIETLGPQLIEAFEPLFEHLI
ncbi:MAG: bifunctional oligoribonuclease/PAP phosphatase NrnA [Spirochaetaceae bacterium]|jgi:phosphoesterase RecJ-like protein|nr:bifunctional oligoribonuclease/PAP phosphatase NrnA [Spirochaetaceae bacterium]